MLLLGLQSTAPIAALRVRANRMTDAALLEAAHALGKYEIRPEPEDLAGPGSSRTCMEPSQEHK